MKLSDFPDDIKPYLIPEPNGDMFYRCLGCNKTFGIEKLLYTCPACSQVLLLYDNHFNSLKDIPGNLWHKIFDYRKMLNLPAVKGIYRFHEFIGSVIPLESIVYLGEGHTPVIRANKTLEAAAGGPFFFKNDGQNPSASFKDRGMASALSYIQFLIHSGKLSEVLAICASTGDTSASAALYGSYLTPHIKSAVLLPHKKVTPQQLSQPLGSGAVVFEMPGVFDDCMKVVESLSSQYKVALLNSKNAWRILGQESYSYEIAQEFEYDLADKVIILPIGNAGNLSAVMSGFIKFYEAGIINTLPKIIGVQSSHADPVFRYYSEPVPAKRKFVPVAVKPSVAQAAMIGNPVSMPRIIHLENAYNEFAGKQKVFFVQVEEQSIMDWGLKANRNGHIACTHGGESLAAFVKARSLGLIDANEVGVIDSTAHAIKFSGFQDMYFQKTIPADFEISSNPELINLPVYLRPNDLEKVPEPGKPLEGKDLEIFINRISDEIAAYLKLSK
ncbi:MAG: pyridoxal-phosphate dependent enzyme [Proteobacteria bacterium]|nr:pyridoxal-phosphate dependent enzyme [Pseudomonadota bacterium]MBU4469625.1 pyridoxal-phosphate dependent enzyme [Pseudomonadota bacterium]MCG2753303.1 pyridoxal-phosphate dependent enzyme [Desulfobacteraceae bacterium]